jgi:hypothetical protein
MTIFQGVILNGTEVINAPTIVGNTVFQTTDQTITFGTPLAAASTRLSQDTTRAQLVLGLGTALGNQFVIGENAWIGHDYDHAVQTNPTLFIHSAIDPDTFSNQWFSFAHDQTDCIITSGKGSFRFNGPSGCSVIGYQTIFTRHYVNNYGDGAPCGYITVNGFMLHLATCGNLVGVVDRANNFDDYAHAAPAANPEFYVHSATAAATATDQWIMLVHDQTNGGVSTGKGNLILNPVTEITEVCGVGLKTKEFNATLNDDATISLPAGTGWGTFMIGDNQEFARVRWTSAAVVSLDEGTANVATADTDAFFCIYDGGATVTVKNRLGANLTLRGVIHYS